jgi:glutathione reductase (NADPH)
MPTTQVDLFVIGGGSGGVRAARIAAGHGAKVMLAEEFRMGGTCVVRGCVPKKLYVYASRFCSLLNEAADYGWAPTQSTFHWNTLVSAKEREIGRLEGIYVQTQAAAGVEVARSRAVLEDPLTVRLLADGRRVRAKAILLATGSRPQLPSLRGIEHTVTSNEIFDLPHFPKRLAVAGAGYIAVEFASLFRSLGSEVHIICRGDSILRGFDGDVREVLASSMRARGIQLMLRDCIVSIEPTPDGSGLGVRTMAGIRFEADQVLVATGRIPNTANIGLDGAGVQLGADGAVVVDAEARTNVPHIYAIGDVTNRFNLTPVAIREGHALADRLFGQSSSPIDYNLVPTAVFTTPEVGFVGLSEEAARTRYAAVDVHKTAFRSVCGAHAVDPRPALLKLIVNGTTGALLGVHLIGDDAGEIIQLMAIAIRSGATLEAVLDALADHPTLADELADLRKPAVRYDAGLVMA